MHLVENIDQLPGQGIIVVLHIIGLRIIDDPVVQGQRKVEMDDVHNDDVVTKVMPGGVIQKSGSSRTINGLDFQCGRNSEDGSRFLDVQGNIMANGSQMVRIRQTQSVPSPVEEGVSVESNIHNNPTLSNFIEYLPDPCQQGLRYQYANRIKNIEGMNTHTHAGGSQLRTVPSSEQPQSNILHRCVLQSPKWYVLPNNPLPL